MCKELKAEVKLDGDAAFQVVIKPTGEKKGVSLGYKIVKPVGYRGLTIWHAEDKCAELLLFRALRMICQKKCGSSK